VLCFYPMDFSPVCSTEMKCASDELARWKAKGATVVGISCDSFFVHDAWARSLGLQQTLLADMHRQVCKAYGIYWPDLNISGRGTVVVGRDGKVRWSQKREIKDAMNPDQVLAALS
jgi:peroxiredoxin